MRSPRRILTAARATSLALALASCSSPATPYVPVDISLDLPGVGPRPAGLEQARFGYTEYEISPTIVRVRFSGNPSTDEARAVDFALLRSAEVALERGYPFFVVRDRIDASFLRTYTRTTPGSWFTTCDSNGRCTTAGTPPTTTTHVRRWPVHDHLIELLEETSGEDETSFVLDARFVQLALRRKYGLLMPLTTPERGAIE